jgi:tetratricopeptide (TPR) repeat protein
MPVDPATSQSLYDALKDFISADATTQHGWVYNAAKDFQQLIAALVAIGAAWIAYKGAVEPVKLNRELAERQRATERQPLYFKVLGELQTLVGSLEEAIERMDKAVPQRPGYEDDVPWEGFRYAIYASYSEIEKAWDNLQLMPRDAIEPLNAVRANFKVAKLFTEQNEREKRVEGYIFLVVRSSFSKIVEDGKVVINVLRAALKEFPPDN